MAFSSFSAGAKFSGVSFAALVLSACSTTAPPAQSSANAGSDDYRDAIGVFSSAAPDQHLDPVAAAAFWGTRYNTDHANPETAVKFAAALRKIGSTDEAANVMQKAVGQFPGHAGVNLEYGKVLVESERAFEAVRYLETAVQADPNDWRALSAYGVAFDQIGEHAQARRIYDRALAMAPGQMSVLNNKGLSYALEGDLSKAQAVLRQALAGGGDARMRQNLALVLAIGGDLREAERLARSDLPPIVADNNIGVYRQLVNQPAYWGEYAAATTDIPAFDAAPAAPLSPATPDVQPTPRLREEPKPEGETTPDETPIAAATAPINTSAGAAPANAAPVEVAPVDALPQAADPEADGAPQRLTPTPAPVEAAPLAPEIFNNTDKS